VQSRQTRCSRLQAVAACVNARVAARMLAGQQRLHTLWRVTAHTATAVADAADLHHL
jgi:hypothetical protein